MKSLLLALLLVAAPAFAGVQGAPVPAAQTFPFDAAIVVTSPVAPTLVLVQHGDTLSVSSTLPSVADETTVFTISWPCQGCKIEVIVPKKDGEDTGAWKRRIKIAVDAAKELFPPDPAS